MASSRSFVPPDIPGKRRQLFGGLFSRGPRVLWAFKNEKKKKDQK
jgi:hypothetical protein